MRYSFPNFKTLEKQDKELVDHFVNKYLPYSDFNFDSLWSYNTEDSVRVLDPSGRVSRVESQRVRHAQGQCLRLTVLRPEDPERVRVDVAFEQHVLPETARVVVIDVTQVQHVRAEIRLPFERGAGLLVHGPPFRSLLAGGRRSVQDLALATVEA